MSYDPECPECGSYNITTYSHADKDNEFKCRDCGLEQKAGEK